MWRSLRSGHAERRQTRDKLAAKSVTNPLLYSTLAKSVTNPTQRQPAATDTELHPECNEGRPKTHSCNLNFNKRSRNVSKNSSVRCSHCNQERGENVSKNAIIMVFQSPARHRPFSTMQSWKYNLLDFCWISHHKVVAVVIIRCMDRVADFPGKKPPKLQSFAFRKPQFQLRREQRVLQASQTKGVGNRHILCPTERSSRINECLEIESDVNASPKLFCPRCQLFGVPMPRHELQK